MEFSWDRIFDFWGRQPSKRSYCSNRPRWVAANIHFYTKPAGCLTCPLRSTFHIDYLGNAYLYGNLYAQQTWMWSDRKLKDKIETCTKAIEKINALRGVTHDTKDSIEIDDNSYYSSIDSTSKFKASKGLNAVIKKSMIAYGKNFNTKKQYGLIAQEVEKIIPEAVMMNKLGIKTVNYNAIIPFLVEAIKELNAKNESIEARLKKLES